MAKVEVLIGKPGTGHEFKIKYKGDVLSTNVNLDPIIVNKKYNGKRHK